MQISLIVHHEGSHYTGVCMLQRVFEDVQPQLQPQSQPQPQSQLEPTPGQGSSGPSASPRQMSQEVVTLETSVPPRESSLHQAKRPRIILSTASPDPDPIPVPVSDKVSVPPTTLTQPTLPDTISDIDSDTEPLVLTGNKEPSAKKSKGKEAVMIDAPTRHIDNASIT
ncbi:hypothetical protein I317_01096 [Kwoniella heveanensis CBS 569]|nr:hypothetical protein I317_01096 [Kwoniella heveanensis CBS 569]